ncbi:MAG: hypothetical protein ABEI32_16915, partial [Halothece sp.]
MANCLSETRLIQVPLSRSYLWIVLHDSTKSLPLRRHDVAKLPFFGIALLNSPSETPSGGIPVN